MKVIISEGQAMFCGGREAGGSHHWWIWSASRARLFSLLFIFCWAGIGALAADSNQQKADEAVIARFHQWCGGFLAAPGAGAKAQLLPEGLALAKDRREAFKRMIRQDPARALELSEPAAVRRSVPAEMAGLLEEQISGVGDIVMRHDEAATAGLSADGLAREAHVNGRVFAAHVHGWRLVDQDFDTARRLFTLLTALHWKGEA